MMQKHLKTTLLVLTIIMVVGFIYFMFKKGDDNGSIDLTGMDSTPKAQKPSSTGQPVNGIAEAPATKEKKPYPNEDTGPKVINMKPPTTIEVGKWNPTSKTFQYRVVHDGQVEVGEFAPGQEPVDQKMGAGRMVVLQGHSAEAIMDFMALGAVKYRTKPARPNKKLIVTTIKQLQVLPKTILNDPYLNAFARKYYTEESVAEAQKYASHKGNKALLLEVAQNVHDDLVAFTARYATIMVFTHPVMESTRLATIYVLDLETGERILLEGQTT